MGQVAHEHSKRPAHERFKVQRESGADWGVIDRSKNIPIATGLGLTEAQQLADARNKKRRRKKLAWATTKQIQIA